jgi:hypothetical protein
MKSGRPISILIVLACMLGTTGRAQNKIGADGNPIPIDAVDEPHHSMVLENEYVRVFSFELGPQKSTALMVYPNDNVEVAISGGSLELTAYPHQAAAGVWEVPKGRVKFWYGRHPFQQRNDETVSTYRSVMVEIKKASQQTYNCNSFDGNCFADYDTVPPALEPDKTFAKSLDRDTVRMTDVQILPKEEWKSHLSKLPYLVVAVSDVDLIDTSNADGALEFKAPSGGVQWAPKSFLGTLKNMSDKPGRFVILELK